MALVFRITGDCPACGRTNAIGCISVRSDHVHRGCISCRYREDIPLPRLQKKVLYLDQCFFSRAFRQSAMSKKYIDAVARLKELTQRQVLVVPYSSVHEDETYLWSGSSKEAMDFIKATSGGFKMEPPYAVQRAQLLAAFGRHLRGDPVDSGVDPSDALPDDVHGWTDYIWIDLTNDYFGDAPKLARTKEKSVDQLLDLFPQWRASPNDFGADVSAEYRSAARVYVDAYKDYIEKLLFGGRSASLMAHTNSKAIEEMMTCFDSDTPTRERSRSILAFFESEHFRLAANQLVSTYAFAVLRDQVRRGAYKNREKARRRLKGLFLDIEHVATYGPYCDAVFVDNAIAAMMRDPRIDLEKRFGAKVFCDADWSKFSAWMDTLDAHLSAEHVSGLADAYPDSIVDSIDAMRAVVNARSLSSKVA